MMLRDVLQDLGVVEIYVGLTKLYSSLLLYPFPITCFVATSIFRPLTVNLVSLFLTGFVYFYTPRVTAIFL